MTTLMSAAAGPPQAPCHRLPSDMKLDYRKTPSSAGRQNAASVAIKEPDWRRCLHSAEDAGFIWAGC